MGSAIGGYSKSSLTDKQKENFDKHLKRMEEDVRITYKAHFQSSSYYEHWAKALEILFMVTIPPSTSAFIWGMQHSIPAVRANIIGVSILGIVGSALFKLADTPLHPRNQQERHFETGIKLSSLHKKIQAFREFSVNDNCVDVKQFLEELNKLIKEKEECDRIIQSETWAFETVRLYDKRKERDRVNKKNSETSTE